MAIALALVEMIGLVLLARVIGLLAGTEAAGGRIVDRLLISLGLEIVDRSATALCVVMALVYLGRTAFALFVQSRLHKTLSVAESRVAVQLFDGYVREDFAVHEARRSIDQVRLAHQGLDVAFTRAVAGTWLVIIEGLSVAAIGVSLLVLAPGAAAVLATYFILTVGLLLRWTSRWNRRLGDNFLAQSRASTALMQEVLYGLKEVRVARASGFFGRKFEIIRSETASIKQRIRLANDLPRYILEAVLVVGVAAVGAYSASADQRGAEFAILAAGALRVLPGVTRLTSAATSARMGRAEVDLVLAELAGVAREPVWEGNGTAYENAAYTDPSVHVADLSFAYSDGVQVLGPGLNRSWGPGHVHLIVGESGSGKSTLLDLLLGLRQPTEGSVEVCGVPARPAARGGLIGYLPQNFLLFEGTLAENVAFGVDAASADHERVSEALESVGLGAGSGFSLDYRIEQRGRGLSGGQAQRVGLARLIYSPASVLVLDEPTSALDAATASNIADQIRHLARDRVVIVATHQAETFLGMGENTLNLTRPQSRKDPASSH